jgi:hypothetical protein
MRTKLRPAVSKRAEPQRSAAAHAVCVERQRLAQCTPHDLAWKKWGPYLSERQWGTVREDYSADGDVWGYFPHDHARSRAYRWGEDGLAGFSDHEQRLCLSLALWNGRDPILKERLFGLTNGEGNHGEDVKELYYYLDATPTHSYAKMLYKYPQREYPYAGLLEESRRRSRSETEYELLDTGVFAENRYFDVFVEYAKASANDILIRVTAVNRASESAPLHLLPTVWFRNTWSWGGGDPRPVLRSVDDPRRIVALDHPAAGRYTLRLEGMPELLFTDNETNATRLFGVPNPTPFVKDGINDFVVGGVKDAVNPAHSGTKAAGTTRRSSNRMNLSSSAYA